MTQEATTTEEPARCLLPDEAQEARRADIEDTVYARVEDVNELENGFELVFPADPELAELVLEELLEERVCCPAFDLSLGFEREHGPMTVAFQGPPELKDALRDTLEMMNVAGVAGNASARTDAPSGEAEEVSGCGCGCGTA